MLTIATSFDSSPASEAGGAQPTVALGREAREYAGRAAARDEDVYHASNGQENDAGAYSRRSIMQNQEEETGLSHEEKEMVKELQARDNEVRQHEQAHAALLGPYMRGAPSYVYQPGPDGKMYAVGGSVAVDTGKESTPEATAMKAQVLKTAASGVSDASSADMSVAAMAGAMATEAQGEMTA